MSPWNEPGAGKHKGKPGGGAPSGIAGSVARGVRSVRPGSFDGLPAKPGESLFAPPGAEAERLAGRSLEREIIAGVEHFKMGQHHATIEARNVTDFFDPTA